MTDITTLRKRLEDAIDKYADAYAQIGSYATSDEMAAYGVAKERLDKLLDEYAEQAALNHELKLYQHKMRK